MSRAPRPTATPPEPGRLSALLEALAREPPTPANLAGAPPGPGEKVGRFEVVRELGRGGFGVVLEAMDPLLQRRVALKLVRPGRRVEVGGPTLAEAVAVAQLSHPNIVGLHDAGVSDAGPYLVFEKLDGEPLSSRLERGPLPPAEATHVALEIARALAHAHRNAVVHRDLKPSNVFLCSDGQVKVLDFGLAVVFGRRAALDGGTPGWMAPEQRRGAPEDERTDVWALGAIVFHALTGREPAGMRLAVEGQPELVRLVERMLEPDPVKRPRDAAEVVEALEPIVRGIETPSRPAAVRVSRRLVRTAWRAAAALTLLGAAAVLVWRFGPRSPTPASAGPPLVAVADFANGTGDPDLDGIGSLVATGLQESPGLRVLTRSRMVDLQRQLGNGAERIDESTGREIGRRAGVRSLLVGSVRRMGELLVVELRALDPGRGEYLFSIREQAQGKSGVLPLLDRLTARARRQLVGDGAPAEAAAPVAQLVTANLEAYRHYETGRSLADRNLPGAQEEYRKAIQLDPEFALAHYALALAASLARAPIGELGAIATAAVHAAGRAPWREARLIRAWNAMFERRLGDARADYKDILERQPDDKEVLALYAAISASPEEAFAYLERALQADPSYVPAQEQVVWVMRDLGRQAELIPLARAWVEQPPAPRRLAAAAFAFMMAGDLDRALEAAKREDLLSPGRPTLEVIRLARGEFAEAERVARARIERTGTGYVPLANALSYQGRAREALAVLAEAARRGFQRSGYSGLSIATGYGPSDQLRARVRQLVGAHPGLDWLAALALAVAGDLPEAERYTRALPREDADPSVMLFSDEVRAIRVLVDALVTRARGDAASGHAKLREVVALRRFKARVVGSFALGQACAEDGDLDCAVAALRQYRTEHLPIVLFQSWMFPRSALLLAEVLERQGQADEARGLVARLLSDWRSADPDLPELARARALCARLECQPRRTR